MSDYTQMWSDLGLDLKAHDAPDVFCEIIAPAFGVALGAATKADRKSHKVVVGGIAT